MGLPILYKFDISSNLDPEVEPELVLLRRLRQNQENAWLVNNTNNKSTSITFGFIFCNKRDVNKQNWLFFF